MAVIDSLEVQLQGNAKSAGAAIDDLNKKLDGLIDRIGSLGNLPGMSAMAENLRQFTAGISAATKSAEPQMRKVSRTAEEVSKKFENLGKGFKLSGTADYIQKQLDSYKNALAGARLKEEELSAKGRIDTKGYEDAAANVQKYTNIVESLTGQLQEMQSTAQSLDSINIHLMSDSDLQAMDDIARLGETRPFENIWEGAEIPPELKAGADSTETSVQSLSEKMHDFQKMLSQLVVPDVQEGNLDKLYAALEKAEAKLGQLRVKLENGVTMGRIAESVDDSGFRSLQEQIAIAEKQAEALRVKIAQVGSQSGATGEIDVFRDALSRLSAAGKKAGAALSGFASATKKIGAGLAGAASKIAGLVKSMSGLKKSSDKMSISLSGGFRTFLKYAFGLEGIRAALNKLQGGFRDGMKNLAQYSGEVNASMSLLSNSVNQTKNAFAAAAAPILNAFAPAINQIIQLCIRAANAVNQFVSSLLGGNTWIKAKALTDDYAGSVNKAGKAAKGALRQFDELKTITLQDKDGGSGSASAGDMFETVSTDSGISGFAAHLRELAESGDWEEIGLVIAGKLNAGFQKIKGFISWESVGDKITEFTSAVTSGLNGLVDGTDFGLIGQTIGAGISTVAYTLNQLITGFDWTALGTKFADGISGLAAEVDFTNLGELIGNKFMTVWDILYGLVTGLDWETIGTELGNLLNGVVGSIDLSAMGAVLGQSFTGMFRAAIDFVAAFDWSGLGENIYSGINTFFANTDFAAIGQGISDFAAGLLDTMAVAISGTDWLKVGDSVAQALNNIDWVSVIGSLAQTVGEAAEGALNIVTGFVEGMDWGKLGSDLWESLVAIITGIDWGTLVSQAFELLGAAVAGAAGLIGGLVTAIGNTLEEAIFSVGDYFSGFIEDAGGNIVSGILNGILNGLANIGQWISEHIFQPFIDGFKAAFGIHSPSTVMAEMGNFLMEGLLGGITALIDTVVDAIQIVWNGIKGVFDGFMQFFKGVFTGDWRAAWDGVKQIFSSVWDGIKGIASIAVNTVSGIIGTAWNGIKNVTSTVWNGIKTFVSGLWNGIKTNAFNVFNGIKTTITNIWEGIKTVTTNVWNGIKNAVKTPINAIIGFINGMVSGVVGGMNGMIGALNKISIDVPGWVTSLTGIEKFGFNLSYIEAPQIPYLAKGAVFRGGEPFLAVVNDQKMGQTNIEAPLKTIQEAVRIELDKFSANFRMAMPDTSVYSYRPMTAPEIGYAGAYGNYQHDMSAYMPGGYNSGGSGLLAMTEAQAYNMVYTAVSTAMRNNKASDGDINLQVNLDGDVVYRDIVKRTREQSNRIFGGRLVLADEVY